MTKEQAVEELKLEQKRSDIEAPHENADYILCELLISLGHEEVVSEYRKIGKWYA